MALHNVYATSHLNNGEENRSKWYLSSGTPSQVPISTKRREKKKKERKRNYLPVSFPRARVYILWGSFNIWGCHSTKSDGIPACETDIPGPEITPKRGSSLTCVLHDWNGSRTQNSRFCLHLLLALYHASCLGGCEHGVVGGRASVRCRCRASSTMDTERVGRWPLTEMRTRDASHGRCDLNGIILVRFPVILVV